MIFNLQAQPSLWDSDGTQTLFPEKCTLIHEFVFKVQGFMGPLKPIYILLRLRFLDYRLIHFFFPFHLIHSWIHSFIHSLIHSPSQICNLWHTMHSSQSITVMVSSVAPRLWVPAGSRGVLFSVLCHNAILWPGREILLALQKSELPCLTHSCSIISLRMDSPL